MSRTSAFAYLRVSGAAQLDGDGFPRQLAAVRKYVAGHDMRLAEVFEEKALPGKTEWEHRPAWTAMLQTITSNGVRTIVIEKLDRLARDLMVQEHIVADLRKRGITLISAMEPDLCIDDPTRKLMRQIMGAISEYDRAMITLKLQAGKARKRAATGKCEGRKLYGEKPGESAVRDRIRTMRKKGATLQAICDTLNAEGVATRYGRIWMPMTVARIAKR
jgi:DNA invertase Pin-like site-specific DNA recombinase